jgi:hypothetical protein
VARDAPLGILVGVVALIPVVRRQSRVRRKRGSLGNSRTRRSIRRGRCRGASRSIPAITRSTIVARSNSAKTVCAEAGSGVHVSVPSAEVTRQALSAPGDRLDQEGRALRRGAVPTPTETAGALGAITTLLALVALPGVGIGDPEKSRLSSLGASPKRIVLALPREGPCVF